MTGHQPALYHPGVWIKNFVLDRLAREHRAHAVHLLIDNDVVTDASIRVPTGDISRPRVEAISFDRSIGEMPYEARTIVNPDQFATFADRVSAAVKPFVDEPLLCDLWPDVISASLNANQNLGRSLAQARHRLEGQWGLQTLEVPLSSICDHASFRYFAFHLLCELPRLIEIYNSSLAEYRDVNRVRSKTHPVPALNSGDGWLEAPFWLWTDEEPIRRRLFCRFVGAELEINDRNEICHRLTLQPDRAVEQLAELTEQGLRLRPRALLTTMFVRLFLCDVFIHGIGGAKYDQLTDAIIERFFKIHPPTFLVATATAKLPIDRPHVGRDDLLRITKTLRDLDFNPQRHLEDSSEVRHLRAAKAALLAVPAQIGKKLERHRQITQLNNDMQPFVMPLRKTLLDRQTRVVQQLRAERLLGSREYAFCLFAERTLRPFLLDI